MVKRGPRWECGRRLRGELRCGVQNGVILASTGQRPSKSASTPGRWRVTSSSGSAQPSFAKSSRIVCLGGTILGDTAKTRLAGASGRGIRCVTWLCGSIQGDLRWQGSPGAETRYLLVQATSSRGNTDAAFRTLLHSGCRQFGYKLELPVRRET